MTGPTDDDGDLIQHLVRGLAQTHHARLGHAQHPGRCEKHGELVARELFHRIG